MTQIPPETDPFVELVTKLKDAIARDDQQEIEKYNYEIGLYPDHINRLVALVP